MKAIGHITTLKLHYLGIAYPSINGLQASLVEWCKHKNLQAMSYRSTQPALRHWPPGSFISWAGHPMPACPNHRSRIDRLYPAHHPNPACTRRRAGQETEARREWIHPAAGGWRTRRNWGATWVRCQQRNHNRKRWSCRSPWHHQPCHQKDFLNRQRMRNTIMMLKLNWFWW